MTTKKLGDLAHIFTGVPLRTRTLSLSDAVSQLRLLDTRSITGGWITAALSSIDEASFNYNPKYTVQPLDVVIAARGSSLKTALVPAEAAGAVISGNVIAIRTDPQQLNPVMLLAFLQTPAGIAALMSGVQTSTALLSLRPSAVAAIDLPLMPLIKQNIIAELYLASLESHRFAIAAAEARRNLAINVISDQLFHNVLEQN